MKTCPYCAEEIQDAAVKCRHCGEVTVSQEWREFCGNYATWDAGRQTDEFQALSDEQKTEFRAAWTALGHDKAPAPAPATPPTQEGSMSKGFKGAIGVVLGLGCISIVIPLLLLGGLGGLGACIAGLGGMAEPGLDETNMVVPPGIKKARQAMTSKVRDHYERVPIGGGWETGEVWFKGQRVWVKVTLPPDARIPERRAIGMTACPGKLEGVPSPMIEVYAGAQHLTSVDCDNWRN